MASKRAARMVCRDLRPSASTLHPRAILTQTPTILPRGRPASTAHPTRRLQARFFTTSPRQQLPSDEQSSQLSQPRESDAVDVCIVGGGPAGLAAAIRLKQLANAAGNDEFRVLLLEKASDMGGHTVSGAVIEPHVLTALLPDWLSESNPERFTGATACTGDKMRFLTKTLAIPLPEPPQMRNHGNYIVSLNSLVRWLAERAEEIGVEVFPGFAASEVVYTPDGQAVKGVATNDLGVGRDGKPKASFERGMEFHARMTLFAEGCHGSLTKQLCRKFELRRDSEPQTYGLGVKEVWEVLPERFKSGQVVHSLGWPLPRDTYGGAFLYHFGENLVSVGMVVGLDYPNPWMSPYQEFQRLKHHPLFKEVLEGGKCISYAARALNEGGFQSIPKLVFPGGALIGDTAGFLNLPKIKGTHTSMKSGVLAAEATYAALTDSPATEADADDSSAAVLLTAYSDAVRASSIHKELKEVRNMRPSFHTPLGLYGGVLYSGIDAFLFKGRTPWTLHHPGPDHAATRPASEVQKIEYPKPDGKLSFDILTSVSRTGTNHEEDQPVHLQVKDWAAHGRREWPKFQGVESRFCPAGVYEYVEDEAAELGVRFHINSQNCIHCKTCDIKAPSQDINWQTPQGGEGPKYTLT
ncbi:putative mitochondrial electron transfer flavoprotein-ubiquinone oxidoreductase [Drechslerella stenobrocha 248]|uniref:Electron transfer flavoprotein-ubiquinone oxidoreductase n=1 Tax=Drechslerella stenobrocha 248 TaxID=1043628 RepID=W7IAV5_9PEZI|nr:putative mitochondrial electron transfer flavoprotein-ubiquinone oxidoreductase [Drechslerella stenobrocha 248]